MTPAELREQALKEIEDLGPEPSGVELELWREERWGAVVLLCGLADDDTELLRGTHALRHSAAARMIQAGASPKAVQVVLGHTNAAFTLNIYGHVFSDDLDDLAARMDSPCSPDVAPAPIRLHSRGQ